MTKTRTLAALVMGPLAILAVLFLPTPWLMVLAAVLFLAGLWEWFSLADVEDTLTRMFLLAANLLLMVMLVWASRTDRGGSLALFHLAIFIGVIWWCFAALWLKFPQFGSHHEGWARAIKLAAGTLALLPAGCALAVIHGDPADTGRIGIIPRNHLWLLTALMMIWMADTGAYFAGRKFGKHKLAPRISPNKTVEGLAGGAIAAMVFGLIFAMIAGASIADLPWVALTALITVAASVVGDLFESMLKRHAGVKDSSDLIPGHGGILDRMDSVLAALPVFAVCKASFGF